MPTFSATYTTSAGQTRTLRVQASDLSAARRSLRQRGIVPSSLQQVAASAAPGAAKGSSSLFSADLGKLLEARPGVREKALFANKMAAMVDAGVPIVRSLSLMAEQQKMPLFKRALQAVTADVTQGEALGVSMRRWPKVFDKLTIAMVEAGEVGGVLDETLRRLSIVLEGNAKLQNQIKGAMGYPVSVLVIAILVFLGMTIFVIPTFAGIFDSLGAKLPPFTQLLVDLSKLLRSPFALVLVAVLVVIVALFLRYYATPAGRLRVDVKGQNDFVTQADRETEIACWYDSTRDELVRAERHALTAPADQRWVEVYRYRFDFGMVSWSWSGAGREVLPVDHTEAITATGPIKVFGVDLDGVVGWRWVLGDGGLPPPLTAEPRPVLASPPPPPPPPPAPRPKRPSWIERMGL